MNLFVVLTIVFLIVGILTEILGVVLFIALDEMIAILVPGLIGAAFLITSLILWIVYQSLKKKRALAKQLRKTGIRVMGKIQRVYLTPVEYHYEAKWIRPYYIDCLATNPITGEQKIYRSDALFYNPSGLLRVEELPVYFDSTGKKSHVDTSPIIPEDAILHKFRTAFFNRKLMKTGRRLTTQIIGVELAGAVAIADGGVPVKLPKILEGFDLPVDEYGYVHLGYDILSSYTDETGQVHIFGSKEFWGRPKRDYTGEQIDVYVDKTYQKYYADYESLGVGEEMR